MANVYEQFDPYSIETATVNPYAQFDPNMPAEDTNSYGSRVMSTIGKNLNQGADILLNSNANPLPRAIQVGGAAARATMAPISEAVKSGMEYIPDAVMQPVAKAVNAVAESPHYLASALENTKSGQEFGDYGMAHPKLQESMQETSDTAKALADILSTVPPSKAAEATGNAMYESGKGSADAAREAYVQDLVLPKAAPTVAEEQAGNSVSKGIFNTRTYVPSAGEKAIADDVAAIPGIKPGNTMLDNYNLIKGANEAEAQGLADKLTASGAPYDPNNLLTKISTAADTLKNSPHLANAPKTVDSMTDMALEHITNNPPTAAGLLQARKDFDAQLLSERGGIFDMVNDTSVKRAALGIRKAMNDAISDAAAPHGIDVKDSLGTQSNYFNAMANIAPKVAAEAPNAVGRAVQNMKATFAPTTIKGLSADAGLGAAAYLGATHPLALATGLAGYGAYKGATAPTTRMVLGQLLAGGKP